MSSRTRFFPIDLNALLENNYLLDETESPLPRNLHIDLNQFPDEDSDEGFICNTDIEYSNMNHPPNKKKNMSIDKKRAVFEMIVKEQQDRRLAKGVRSKVATLFSISKASVSRIWNEGKSFSTMNSDLWFSSKLLNRRN